MRRFNSLLGLSLALAFVVSAGTAGASGGACPSCVAKLDITSTSQRLGDITRDPDSTYSTWGAGTVYLSCDDGGATKDVDLGLEPSDLAEGIDLTGATLPDVDLTASGLDCWIDVDTDTQSSVIDVDLI